MKRELKVLIIGKPGAGKSTLAHFIKNTLQADQIHTTLIDEGGCLAFGSLKHLQDTEIVIETKQAHQAGIKHRNKRGY